jgi:hypothetical protein
MTVRGALYQLQPPARRITATDFGLWVTPTAADATPRGRSKRVVVAKSGKIRHVNKQGGTSFIPLAQQVTLYGTPMANDAKNVSFINPEWVEALMGYPRGWTDISSLPRWGWHSASTNQRAQWIRWLKITGIAFKRSETPLFRRWCFRWRS